MRRMLAGLLLALCMLHTGVAQAARSVTFDVPRTGGAYTVKVHPDLLTVLYFPDDVVIAYALQESSPFVIVQHERSVTVQAKPGATYGNVNIKTKTLHVGVLLEVVDDPQEAFLQVEFRDQDAQAALDRRVQREVEKRIRAREQELARAAAELEEKRRHLDQVARETALRHIARGLLLRHHSSNIERAVRTRAISFRLHRVMWIGQDAYLFFSIENRDSRRYELGTIDVRVGGKDRAGPVVFSSAATEGTAGAPTGSLGLIMPRSREHGVVAFPDARKWRGDYVTIVLRAGPDIRKDLSFTFPLPD